MSAELLEQARAALGAGDPLIAFDAAATALAGDPMGLEARYLVALSLARAGATDRAQEHAERLRAAIATRADVEPSFREDVEALLARLLKDRALAATGREQTRLAAEAARMYEDTARRLERHYSCVNAATLWLVARDPDHAQELAHLALRYAELGDDDPTSTYWRAATRAEASLVLGDHETVEASLAEAARTDVGVALRATTRRQLALICSITGADPSLLDAVALPTVVHYCGHRLNEGGRSRLPMDLVDEVSRRAAVLLDESECGIAYGSLASGADILIAEALFERNAELHVVLPFSVEEFEHESVRSAGSAWVDRFHALLGQATSVTLAYDSSYLGDDGLFAYASRLAMGQAITRARTLGSDVRQIAVWDEQVSSGPAGTAHDVAVWRDAGQETITIPVAANEGGRASSTNGSLRRAVRAVLFTDLRGSSRLFDEHYPVLLERVFGPLVAALGPWRDALLFHKTWGDGMQLVFSDVLTAGRAALTMQEVSTSLDLESMGLPVDLDLRIGGHVGPLLELRDPLDQQAGFWGREMARTARIEPLTPEGEVYVTAAFASLLALESDSDLRCEYVGRITTAKDFETIPMYRLIRVGSRL